MKKVVLLLFWLAVVLTGCGDPVVHEEKVDNVVRVFWHEHSSYSVMFKDPVTGGLHMRSFPKNICLRSGSAGIAIHDDIPLGEKMWVYAKIKREDFGDISPCIESLDIHIHSERNIEGGGWSHGKFGSGQTAVLY